MKRKGRVWQRKTKNTKKIHTLVGEALFLLSCSGATSSLSLDSFLVTFFDGNSLSSTLGDLFCRSSCDLDLGGLWRTTSGDWDLSFVFRLEVEEGLGDWDLLVSSDFLGVWVESRFFVLEGGGGSGDDEELESR